MGKPLQEIWTARNGPFTDISASLCGICGPKLKGVVATEPRYVVGDPRYVVRGTATQRSSLNDPIRLQLTVW